MGVDVVHVFRRDTRLPDRVGHHAPAAITVFRRRGHVVRVGRHSIADDLGVNRRAAAARVLQLLDHDDACALADDEPITILVEGTTRALGIVVAR